MFESLKWEWWICWSFNWSKFIWWSMLKLKVEGSLVRVPGIWGASVANRDSPFSFWIFIELAPSKVPICQELKKLRFSCSPVRNPETWGRVSWIKIRPFFMFMNYVLSRALAERSQNKRYICIREVWSASAATHDEEGRAIDVDSPFVIRIIRIPLEPVARHDWERATQ